MDVLLYWKNPKSDLAADRLGWFRASRTKLNELKDGYPENIWIIKTPAGRKGDFQLLGCLRWADRPKVRVPSTEAGSAIFYDPHDERSVWFDGSETDAAIADMTTWVRTHFHTAARANFQGDHGAQPLRGEMLRDLKRLAASFSARPFVEPEQEPEPEPEAAD